MRMPTLLACAVLVLAISPVSADVQLDLGPARLTLDQRGCVTALTLADGTAWPVDDRPVFSLETDQGIRVPESVELAGDLLKVRFQGGAVAEFAVKTTPTAAGPSAATPEGGMAIFELRRLQSDEPPTTLRLFHLAVPPRAEVAGTLNACSTPDWSVAVMGAEPNVDAGLESSGGSRADRPGCSHEFVQAADQFKVGSHAARFTATSDAKPGGWSMRGKRFPAPLDLTGCKAIRAWVYGDGNGQSLKIQLFDGRGGYRDNYLTIDFQGWRQVTLTDPPINTLRYERTDALHFYYNSLPPGKTVTCYVDQVEAMLDRDGAERRRAAGGLRIARFAAVGFAANDAEPPHVRPARHRAGAVRSARLPACGVAGDGAAIRGGGRFAQPRSGRPVEQELALDPPLVLFSHAVSRVAIRRGAGHRQTRRLPHDPDRSGLVVPQHGAFRGQPRPTSPTAWKAWCAPFAASRMPASASACISWPLRSIRPTPYLTPVPDPRLVKGATAKLAADVDPQADFIPTTAAPDAFPAEDGGYKGDGTVLQIGDELIQYAERSLQAPFGFKGCRRGHLGTHAAAHRSGDAVAHLVRSYGYHMFDMDTTLLDEVAHELRPRRQRLRDRHAVLRRLRAAAGRPLVLQRPAAQSVLRQAEEQGRAAAGQQLQPLLVAPAGPHRLGRRPRRSEGLPGRTLALVRVVRPVRHAAGHRLVLRLRPDRDARHVRVRAGRDHGLRRLDVLPGLGRRPPRSIRSRATSWT